MLIAANLSTAKEVMVMDIALDMALVMATAAEVAMESAMDTDTDTAGKAIAVSREDILCQHGADHSAQLLMYQALVEDCLNLDHLLASEEDVLDQEEVLQDAGVDLVLPSFMRPMSLPFSLNTSVVVVLVEALAFKQLSLSLLFKTISNQYGECFSFYEEEKIAYT